MDYNPTHHDDIRVVGKAFESVNYIEIDTEASAARDRGYIRANILRSKEGAERETEASAARDRGYLQANILRTKERERNEKSRG